MGTVLDDREIRLRRRVVVSGVAFLLSAVVLGATIWIDQVMRKASERDRQELEKEGQVLIIDEGPGGPAYDLLGGAGLAAVGILAVSMVVIIVDGVRILRLRRRMGNSEETLF